MNILRYALKNIFRNFFLSISSILTIGLLVFFVNILLFVLSISQDFIVSVNNKIAINLNFKDGYNDTQIRSQEFFSGATEKFPGVKVEYISREKALAVFSERNSDLASIIENASENPLPDSVRISQIPLVSYSQVDEYIGSFRDILQYDEKDMNKKLVDYKLQYERVQQIVGFLQMTTKAIYVFIGLFLFSMFIMIHTVIRNFVFFLQDEVRIIELVGGKPSFIYGPLMVQGTLYTISAVLGAFLVFFLFKEMGGVQWLPEYILGVFEKFYPILLNLYLPVQLLIAVLIGIVSAFLASYKYVHSTIRE